MTDPDNADRRVRRFLPSPTGMPRSSMVVMQFLTRRGNYLYDAVTMLYACISPGGVAHTAPARWCAAGIVVVSLALAESVRRSGRNLFIARVAFSIAAMALITHWADAAHHAYSPIGVPVVVAISMYYGPRGLVVPAAAAAVAAVAETDQRTTIAQAVVVLVLACILGWGLSVYLSLRDRSIARQAALLEQARVIAAHHSGRANILTATEGTADLVQRVGVLLSLHGSTVGRLVGDMKRRATQEVTGVGTFLATVVSGWSARHNRSPDLRRTVDIAVDPNTARVLLTAAQANEVTASLDRLCPNGSSTIRLEHGNPQRIDRPRDISINGQLVTIPPERTTRAWAMSPIPFAAAMVALWMSQPAIIGATDAPLLSVAFSLIALVHAVRVHRLVALADENITRAVTEIVALFVAFAVASIPFAVAVPGNPQVMWPPAEGAAEFVVLVVMLARPYLPTWQQRGLPVFVLLLVTLDALSVLFGSTWRNTIAEGLFVPAMYLATAGIGEGIDRVAQQVNAEHTVRSDVLADEAFRAGCARARTDLSDQLAQLEAEFEHHRDTMDAALAAEIERRITEAERGTAVS